LAGVSSLMGRSENIDLFLYRNEQLSVARSVIGAGKREGMQWKPPRADGVTMTVARTGEPIVIEDIDANERFSTPGWQGAILSLPLKIGTRVVGVMNVTYPEPRTFSDSEQRVLRLLADQAAITIENARLYEQSQKELRERGRAEDELRKVNDQLHSHIDEIETLQTKLREQAVRDPLTGLFNRRYLEETLDRELYRAEREEEPVSVVMIDIDHFKNVNDTYGHKAGDMVLQALGHLLLTHTRRGDVACRYGGEEFIIIMPSASLVAAYERAEQWRLAFAQLDINDEGQQVQATLSIGIAQFPQHGSDINTLLRAADEALYASKAAGRNRVAVFG
jgi:diguanylate cyclase (GGDEF)-like protein